MNITRFARNTSAAAVAGIAGYASYWHQVHVALMAGERDELAHLLPLSVDGLLVVASVAMVDARAEGRQPSWKTKLGFGIGIAASVGANVMSAQPTLLGRGVAAWPAIALLLVVEILSSRGRKLKDTDTPERVTPVAQAEDITSGVPVRLPVPVSPAAPVFRAPIDDEDEDRDDAPPRSWPTPQERAVRSPLTGRVLTDRRPRK
jgi:hypothetical protein